MSEQKRGRGQPRHYEENKQKITVRITPIATNNLDATAQLLGISRSELIERVGRLDKDRLILMLSDRPVVTVDVVADLLVGFAQGTERGELDSGLIWECHDKLLNK